MNKILDWLILSSKDPQKVSLFIKGALGWAATLAIGAGVQASELDFSAAIDQIGNLVYLALTFGSTAVAAYGAIRKIYRTMTGQNEVIN